MTQNITNITPLANVSQELSSNSAQAGETTLAQTTGGLPGSSMGGLAGFFAAAAGTYQTYRQISAHPTSALVRGIVAAPIVGNTWRWKKCRQDVPDEWVNFAQQVLGPLRQSLVRDVLRALEFGWAGFEKIWQVKNGVRRECSR